MMESSCKHLIKHVESLKNIRKSHQIQGFYTSITDEGYIFGKFFFFFIDGELDEK